MYKYSTEYIHGNRCRHHSPNTFHRRLGIFRFFLMRTVTVCVNNGTKDAQFDSSLARDKDIYSIGEAFGLFCGGIIRANFFAKPNQG